MLARLILALLLAAFAIPAAASVPACHDAPMAMTAGHAMPAMPAGADHKAIAAHVCIGCIPPSDWIGGRLADRLRPDDATPIARVARLDAGAGWPPALPPPRMA